MTSSTSDFEDPRVLLERILESARRLGVEMDEEEALQWLTALAAAQHEDEVVVDEEAGVFGHRIVMLDFSPEDLAYARRIGRLVALPNVAGQVETALALSGSSAQSRIQTYPGDLDFFQRVNIQAPTREVACQILAQLMREKALTTRRGPTYQLIEVKFGSYPLDVLRDGRKHKKGAPISWTPAEVDAGYIEAELPNGMPVRLTWDEVAQDPGWCKMDWVVADPVRGRLANASNMLDVTWEAPDGSIHPLDGYLDPYFQEVYLEAESIPVFSKLMQHLAPDALEEYVRQLEGEVHKYLTKDINYGKAAKRMYNIFRFTGRYEEAAFLRELFDEPATVLYQVWTLIRTLDDCCRAESHIPMTTVLAQADKLILDVVHVLEGEREAEIVRQLLRLRDALTRQESGQALSEEAEAARAAVIQVVNEYFYERLIAMPSIRTYIERHQQTQTGVQNVKK